MKITYRDKAWQLEGPRTVREVIKELGLPPDRLLAVREGKVIAENTVLDEDDEIRLIAVISGG